MKESTKLREEMKRDLMKVYREESKEYSGFLQMEIYDRTIHHEAPRFYIDVRRAHQNISPMLRGDRSRLEKMKPLRREMYEALFDVVIRLSQEESYCGKSLYCILRRAVTEPAPRFYIDKTRMGQIWKEQTFKVRVMSKRKLEERRIRKEGNL